MSHMNKAQSITRGYIIGVTTSGEIKKISIEQEGSQLLLSHTNGLGWSHRVQSIGKDAAKREAAHVFAFIKSEEIAQSIIGSEFEAKIIQSMEQEASALRTAITQARAFESK